MVSWFISPWEAARFSMEAQRLIALQLFGLAFPKGQSNEQPREERGSGEVPRRASTIASSEDVSAPLTGIEPVQKRTVAHRSNTQMTKKVSETRKRKSRAGKGKR
jgi:hypothetical protein